jgi:aspartate kinase
VALIIHKYGGTSVGSPERIRKVAERIGEAKEAGDQLVVVVSAMGQSTDELIALAHQVSQSPPHREMDMLLTAGERISMALLSMALSDRNIPAISLTGSQTGIITTDGHRRARIKRILGDRVREGIANGKVVIVAGFQGVSESKEITTLGRGGSDTTAVALAAALKASRCEIYTDVEGVYTADPRVVSDSKLWSRLPAAMMVEMATRGSGVLHPRSVELAEQFKVPLFVKNSLTRGQGTEIVAMGEGDKMEEFDITGVTADHSKCLITVELQRPSAIGCLWDRAAGSHLPIVAPMFAEGIVRFFSDSDGEAEWNKLLSGLSSDGFLRTFKIDSSIVPVSVIGHRFSQDGAVLHNLIETLAENHISVTIGQSSALAATMAVAKTHADDAVKALHSKFVR